MKLSKTSLLAVILTATSITNATKITANFDDVITINGTGSVQQYANLFFNGFKAIDCSFFFDPLPSNATTNTTANPNRKACVSEPNAASTWSNTTKKPVSTPSIATVWGLGINLTSVVFLPFLEANQTENITIAIKGVRLVGLSPSFNYTFLVNETEPVKFTPEVDDPTGSWTNLMRLSFAPTLGNGNGTNATAMFIDDLIVDIGPVPPPPGMARLDL